MTLACRIISATPAITDLFWSKQVNGVYTRITIDNFRFFGGSTSNANLTIANVALSDQTSYQCSATNSAGTGNSGASTLSVSGSMFLFISRLSIMCYKNIHSLIFDEISCIWNANLWVTSITVYIHIPCCGWGKDDEQLFVTNHRLFKCYGFERSHGLSTKGSIWCAWWKDMVYKSYLWLNSDVHQVHV